MQITEVCFRNYRITEALVKADKNVCFKGSNGSVNASFFTLTLSLGALFGRVNSGMLTLRDTLYSSLVFQQEKQIVWEVQSINHFFFFFRRRKVLGARMRVVRQTT